LRVGRTSHRSLYALDVALLGLANDGSGEQAVVQDRSTGNSSAKTLFLAHTTSQFSSRSNLDFAGTPHTVE
jgi:hypothetical protein